MVISLYVVPDGYRLLPLLPVSFIIFWQGVYRGRILEQKPVFFNVLFLVAFFRYVVQPVLLVMSGEYSGRSAREPIDSSYEQSIILIAYELLAITAVIALLERIRRGKDYAVASISKVLSGNYTGLLLFASLGIVFIVSRSSLNLISFFVPSEAVGTDSDVSTLALFFAYFFITCKQLFFLSLLAVLASRYRRQPREILIVAAMVLILANSLVYFGTSRISIVITCTTSLLVAYHLFGKAVVRYSLAVVLCIVVGLAYLTVARNHVSPDSFDASVAYDVVQVYTGGVYNVAIGVETKEEFPEAGSFEVLAFDFLRPTIGLNLLVKNWDTYYSNIYFNKRMWTKIDRRSQILPMIAQSNLFFGRMLSPLLTVFFVLVYYLIDRIRLGSCSLEVRYFLTLLVVRLAMMFGQNSMNVMNFISMNVLLFSCIYYLCRNFTVELEGSDDSYGGLNVE